MKKFIVGFFAVIGFFFFGIFLLGVLVGNLGSDKKTVSIPDKVVLSLSLEDGLKETPPQSSVLAALGPREMTLSEVIQTLDLARQDKRVVGLAARLSANNMGLASIQELRTALENFERSGKFAYVYIDDLGNSAAMNEYWLASSFSQVWLNPVGSLALTGFSVEIPFAKDLLDKIGIQPEIMHQGKYKSFPESVMRNDISPENLEMTTAMLDSIKTEFYHDVNLSRKITADQMDHFIDQALIPAEDALSGGLIDSIGYRDEFDSYIEQSTKGAAAVALEDYRNSGLRAVPGDKMALIHVNGALTTKTTEDALSSEIASADTITDAIAEARDNKDIKAIIVRVDSPGGTPLAADLIRRAIQITTNTKPVVISMSNTAASGGYWMSANANAIIAQPTTLTGSIGVFGGKVNAEALFAKIGINWVALSDNNNSDMWSFTTPYSLESGQKVDAMMRYTYNQFIRHVADGRKMTPEQVEKIAQGRVWTGAQAVKIGLVDQLGGLETAQATAKTLAKIPESHTINLEVFPKPLNPMEELLKFLKGGKFPSSLFGSWIHDSFTAAIQQFLNVDMAMPHIKS